MKMYSCLTCEYRERPIKNHSCKKGLADKKELVLNCLGHSEIQCRKAVQNDCKDKCL